MKVGIIVGSIRDGRKGEQIGQWVHEVASGRDDATFELIDLKSFDVPLLTSATVPGAARKQYDSEQVQAWSGAVDSCDAFVF
ncbi:NAD(P)H-dependent oxidoreductase, partial [Klebsiella pneumoniae]|nr:NAD(P)H-dependent oxidoreductase [Klebsiella pneumoniae]